MNTIEIAGRPVGPGHPTMIVAEIGVNHNGNVDLARKLIDAAKNAGASAVKFQTWRTDRLLITPDSPQYRTLLPLELSYGQFRHLKAHADDVGITFLSTPDQAEDADFLDELVPAFKIGSGNLRNLPFLRHVAAKGKPMLLSTGMADMEAVMDAVEAIKETGNRQLVLLHCASIYPEEPDPKMPTHVVTHWDASPINLRAMDTMATLGYPVGYSDHSLVNCIALAAVARGACVIERHLRLPETQGPDRLVSIGEHQFEAMVRDIRDIESALGDGIKRCMPGEERTREWAESWRR